MKPGFPVKSLNFGSMNARLDSKKNTMGEGFLTFPRHETNNHKLTKVVTSNLLDLKMMDTTSSRISSSEFQDVRKSGKVPVVDGFALRRSGI